MYYDQNVFHACVGRTMTDIVNWRTNLGKNRFLQAQNQIEPRFTIIEQQHEINSRRIQVEVLLDLV